jgi:hypothetical protein
MKISRFAAISLCLLALFLSGGAARAADSLRAEALLIWGTDDEKSPDPSHKPVDAALAGQLGKSPYRWKHYFEVNRKVVEIPANKTKKDIAMSEQCKLDIKNFGNDWVEVKLYGKGKLVSTNKERLPLVLAGYAGNSTAWMVVIRPAPPEPSAKK